MRHAERIKSHPQTGSANSRTMIRSRTIAAPHAQVGLASSEGRHAARDRVRYRRAGNSAADQHREPTHRRSRFDGRSDALRRRAPARQERPSAPLRPSRDGAHDRPSSCACSSFCAFSTRLTARNRGRPTRTPNYVRNFTHTVHSITTC